MMFSPLVCFTNTNDSLNNGKQLNCSWNWIVWIDFPLLSMFWGKATLICLPRFWHIGRLVSNEALKEDEDEFDKPGCTDCDAALDQWVFTWGTNYTIYIHQAEKLIEAAMDKQYNVWMFQITQEDGHRAWLSKYHWQQREKSHKWTMICVWVGFMNLSLFSL